jgi:hypothetical protein
MAALRRVGAACASGTETVTTPRAIAMTTANLVVLLMVRSNPSDYGVFVLFPVLRFAHEYFAFEDVVHTIELVDENMSAFLAFNDFIYIVVHVSSFLGNPATT